MTFYMRSKPHTCFTDNAGMNAHNQLCAVVIPYSTLADSQAAWRALVRTVYAVPQHRNAALQGLAAMLSRVDSEHTMVQRWRCLHQRCC